MLEQFQKAFSDLVASPKLVSEVRGDPAVLRGLYELTDREWRRLVSIADQPGMEISCMLYRANRLTPIIVNLPDLSRLLDDDLGSLLSEYWTLHTHTNANFLVESYRFCEFVEDKIDRGIMTGDKILPVLRREKNDVSKRLKAIYPDDLNKGKPTSVVSTGS